MNYWLNANHPLMTVPGVKQFDHEGKLRQIWKYSPVAFADEQRNVGGRMFWRVMWGKAAFWVEDDYLEPLYDLSGGVSIVPEYHSNRIIEKQYIFVDGKQKFNQCGQFCVARCAGVDTGTFYKTILNDSGLYKTHITQDKVTGVSALSKWCGAFGLKTAPDELLMPITSGRILDDLLREWYLVAGVDIDPLGRIWSPSCGLKKIAHWIVVDQCSDFSGRVGDATLTYFDPFQNGVKYDGRLSDIRPALFVERKKHEDIQLDKKEAAEVYAT